jgi:hypothetical protein
MQTTDCGDCLGINGDYPKNICLMKKAGPLVGVFSVKRARHALLQPTRAVPLRFIIISFKLRQPVLRPNTRKTL